MDHYQVILTVLAVVLLVFISAFFSAAETWLMTVNRYRIRHHARIKKQRFAIHVIRLLQRPDRLLGLVLTGNCFANIFASALATLVAVHFWGEKGVIISTILLTFIVLVFAEVAPKTVAALYADQIAIWVALPVLLLLRLFYPLVWITNIFANGFLRLFGVKLSAVKKEVLGREELRGIVRDAVRVPRKYQGMLLAILDLNRITVNDIMIPAPRITGIDLEWPWEVVSEIISGYPHEWLPVYHQHINQIAGMLQLRKLIHDVLAGRSLGREQLLHHLEEPYYVPEYTPLNIQLLNFQHEHRDTALVVDEYGDIQGLVTLEDILEEIVGEFATDISGTKRLIQLQKDGSYLVDGGISVREFNRLSGWDLPARGPHTVGGLIVEALEAIPRSGTCIRIGGYPMEVLHVGNNRVRIAHLFPPSVADGKQ